MDRLPHIPQLRPDTHITEPFGAFALSPVRLMLWKQIDLFRSASGGRFIRSLLRKLALAGKNGRVDSENIDGVKARLNILDNLTDKSFFIGGDHFEKDFRECAARALSFATKDRDYVYLDIGANTGLLAATVIAKAKALNQPIELIAIEPQTSLIGRLLTNLKFSKASFKYPVFNCALGEEEGFITMVINHSNLGQSQIVIGNNVGQRVPVVPLTRVIESCGCDHIDFLKIDVEGYEFPILSTYFAQSERALWPKHIFAETMFGQGQEVIALLLSLGYAISWKSEADTFFELSDSKLS